MGHAVRPTATWDPMGLVRSESVSVVVEASGISCGGFEASAGASMEGNHQDHGLVVRNTRRGGRREDRT
jgi:hypothetical protein